MKIIILFLAVLFMLFGCGGGSPVAKLPPPPSTPVSKPTPPPPQPPPPPSTPPPVPPPAPAPVIIGQGRNVLLSVSAAADQPLIAWQSPDGARVNSTLYPGELADLQGSLVLTWSDTIETVSTDWIDGTVVTTQQSGATPPILLGPVAAWITGGTSINFSDNRPPAAFDPNGSLIELHSSAHHLAWLFEPSPAECDVFVDGRQMATDALGCPFSIKLVETLTALYIGWCDGRGVAIYRSTDDAQTWQVVFTFTGKQGVFGVDYAIRSDDTIVAGWTEYLPDEAGSAVYTGGSEAARRLSGVVHTGYSGAGNPAVARDGSIAYLDDRNGSVAGHFDVFLDGVDLSNTDLAINEGPRLEVLTDGTRVVAWDDETTVWMEKVPQ